MTRHLIHSDYVLQAGTAYYYLAEALRKIHVNTTDIDGNFHGTADELQAITARLNEATNVLVAETLAQAERVA